MIDEAEDLGYDPGELFSEAEAAVGE
jgi:hypothetical protein